MRVAGAISFSMKTDWQKLLRSSQRTGTLGPTITSVPARASALPTYTMVWGITSCFLQLMRIPNTKEPRRIGHGLPDAQGPDILVSSGGARKFTTLQLVQLVLRDRTFSTLLLTFLSTLPWWPRRISAWLMKRLSELLAAACTLWSSRVAGGWIRKCLILSSFIPKKFLLSRLPSLPSGVAVLSSLRSCSLFRSSFELSKLG